MSFGRVSSTFKGWKIQCLLWYRVRVCCSSAFTGGLNTDAWQNFHFVNANRMELWLKIVMPKTFVSVYYILVDGEIKNHSLIEKESQENH